MYEHGSPHPITYRQEIAAPIFACIEKSESASVVGAGSMGKTRLLDFIQRPDIQQHYLGKAVDESLIVRADLNRMSKENEWSLYEVMLTSLLENCPKNTRSSPYQMAFSKNLRQSVILKENALLAQRSLELAVLTLTDTEGLNICFLLDEFDKIYREFPATVLANLRSLRDQNKNRFSFMLFMRNTAQELRDVSDVESFYELHSRNTFGLKPYSPEDSRRMIAQLEDRNHLRLDETIRQSILAVSGGHPGLLGIVFEELRANPNLIFNGSLDTLLNSPKLVEECKKLLYSLTKSEQEALPILARGGKISDQARQSLELKGLLNEGHIFSSVFLRYLQARP